MVSLSVDFLDIYTVLDITAFIGYLSINDRDKFII